MTDSDKESEIVVRITRLNDIRAELAIVRSAFNKNCYSLANAGRYYDAIVRDKNASRSDKPDPWPSHDEVISIEGTIDTLKSEAETLISELRDLGIDGDLFKINGD